MAGSKEIRGKIRSIQNTQKITRAMEMVAASKMRKAQDRMRAARPYAERMRNVVAHLALSNSEYRHPYLLKREKKRVGVLVISSDRGLCGGLNSNLFRKVLPELAKFDAEGIEVDVATVGTKAAGFFKRIGSNIVAQEGHLGDAPGIDAIIGAVKVMLDRFDEGKIDRLFVAYNHFESSIAQNPVVEQLLPRVAAEDEEIQYHWDYIYEPDAKEILDHVLTRYVESLVYHGVVENIACEQAARMVAMKAASDNASDLIGELQLIYNKARQAAITQEISEIVGGAAAVS